MSTMTQCNTRGNFTFRNWATRTNETFEEYEESGVLAGGLRATEDEYWGDNCIRLKLSFSISWFQSGHGENNSWDRGRGEDRGRVDKYVYVLSNSLHSDVPRSINTLFVFMLTALNHNCHCCFSRRSVVVPHSHQLVSSSPKLSYYIFSFATNLQLSRLW